jgi:hypothetical protein
MQSSVTVEVAVSKNIIWQVSWEIQVFVAFPLLRNQGRLRSERVISNTFFQTG